MARWQRYAVGGALLALLGLGGAVVVAPSTSPGWLGPLMDAPAPTPLRAPTAAPASVAVAFATDPVQPVAGECAQVIVTFSLASDPSAALPVPGVSLAASAAGGAGFAVSAVAPSGGSSRFLLPVRFPAPGVWTLSVTSPDAVGGPFTVTVAPPAGSATAVSEMDPAVAACMPRR